MKTIAVNPNYKYKNSASNWLNDVSHASLVYRVAYLLLAGCKHVENIIGLECGCVQYDRILRQVEKAGKAESEHEMKWRTENYSTVEAEQWAIESINEVFILI